MILIYAWHSESLCWYRESQYTRADIATWDTVEETVCSLISAPSTYNVKDAFNAGKDTFVQVWWFFVLPGMVGVLISAILLYISVGSAFTVLLQLAL